jgi:hypothetical protein
MSEQAGAGGGPQSGGAADQDQLVYGLETRFGPHLEAATAAVREAERELGLARERLAQAEQEAATAGYVSDPLIFMRQSVEEEVDALTRKTTEKKVRASYRFLLDRAVELAAAEVQGFHDDRAAEQQERERGVEACREAERRATETLTAAEQMLDRVRSAEQAAREGLRTMLTKLSSPEV